MPSSDDVHQRGGNILLENRNEDTSENMPLQRSKEGYSRTEIQVDDTEKNDAQVNGSEQRKSYLFKRNVKPRTKRKSALNDMVQVLNVYPRGSEKHDVLSFFSNVRQEDKVELGDMRKKHRNVKWYLNTEIQFRKDVPDDKQETANSHFRSKAYIALENDEEEADMNEAFRKMNQSLEEFTHKGSDWVVDNIVSLYMELPRKIKFTHSIINIQNEDQKCFLWSVLASLHPAVRNPQDVSHYKPYKNELNKEDVEVPVPLKQIEKFERQNSISVNVFGFGGEIFPLYLSEVSNGCREVDLLYISNEATSHYCLIKNLNKFLQSTKKHHKHFYCRRCLHGFMRPDLLDEHRPYCNRFDFQRLKYPVEGKTLVEFNSFHKQLNILFVIYADFETINKSKEQSSPSGGSSTTHLAELEACGYSYQTVCTNDRYSTQPVVYRGEDAADKFVENLLVEEQKIKILKDVEPLRMSTKNEKEFQEATNCYICGRKFHADLIKVRDHVHVGVYGDVNSWEYSNYRGASCQRCNLNLQTPAFIPVVLHNCRGFYSHLILSAVGKYHHNIKVIPNSMGKYISFEVSNLRFLDSFQFTSRSLEDLINNLAEDGLLHFKNLKKAYTNIEIATLLLRKNVYPYDYG